MFRPQPVDPRQCSIDGVLLHVAKPIPGATETLRFLNEHSIPFILLTNGGGKLEADRVKDLSEKLGVPLTTDNFVQSHTPFRELVNAGGPDGKGFRDKTILVTGSDYEKCRSIAESYGFKNVVTPADILAAHRCVFPFAVVADVESAAGDGDRLATRPLPKPLHNTTAAPATAAERAGLLKIDAMFVLNDPRDWALDIQVLADLLLSEQGYMGTYSSKNGNASLPNHGWQRDGQPTLYFSNADLLWAAAYHLPRFGQGAFQAAIAGVWHRLTNGAAPLRRTVIGKPHADTYRFAERVLTAHRNDTLRRLGHLLEQAAEPQCAAAADSNSNPVAAVYMVGDNPESDIAGANGHVSDAGIQWLSALVRTGVWSEERDGHSVLTGVKKPTVVVPDVKAAVQWALQREGWDADF
ncbi:HAD-like domain-containing protein [Lasiosphaeria miniovina]|uniref:HAD-like domain-containing protein n=1 Tax=Lasiosphaeria miniovina TaxID=1954250 RepID=A0AA40AJX5_9PEZI|nr:HAD-like domain-containing protein [Lasiosphaeria miniovina]KAK0717179.1 HAD-like domain-containing protein [Lasiosphaeria miniovina]